MAGRNKELQDDMVVEVEITDNSKDQVFFGLRSVKAMVLEAAADPVLWQDFGNDQLDESWRIDYLTSTRCKAFSSLTLHIINRTYPETIEQSYVVSGVKTDGFKDVPKQSGHSYFVVKSKSGKFFAGSPANTVGGSTDNFDFLIEADTLEKIMIVIKNRSDGLWPTAEQIQSSLSAANQRVKSEGSSSKPVVEFTNIAYGYPDFEVTREKYIFESIMDPDWNLCEV